MSRDTVGNQDDKVAAARRKQVRARAGSRIPARSAGSNVVRASFAQERMWVLHELDPAGPMYNVPTALRLTGPLKVAALAASLTEIVRRHEALRTTFCLDNDQVMQVIHELTPVKLELIDLTGVVEAERQARAEQIA